MNKYPAILKGNSPAHDQVVLAYSPLLALHIEGEFKGETSKRYNTSDAVNITHEYLQNTYGVVESPEHAEFIIELTELHEFVDCGYSEGDNVFLFKGNKLVFIEVKDASKPPFYAIEAKQITIPLPPKAEPKTYPQDNLGKTPRHFDCRCNKCGGKCCSGFCDEWPKVGDEVVAVHPCNKLKGRILALTNKYAIISQGIEEQHLHLGAWSFEKPKTPEEELADELIAKYKHLPSHEQASAIARDVINNAIDKYNITLKALK